jgi:hypothetical protein
VATKYFMVAPICGSSIWNLLHFTCLVPRILKWLLDFFFLENLSTIELNYCLHFGIKRETTRNLRIVGVAVETSTGHLPN